MPHQLPDGTVRSITDDDGTIRHFNVDGRLVGVDATRARVDVSPSTRAGSPPVPVPPPPPPTTDADDLQTLLRSVGDEHVGAMGELFARLEDENRKAPAPRRERPRVSDDEAACDEFMRSLGGAA